MKVSGDDRNRKSISSRSPSLFSSSSVDASPNTSTSTPSATTMIQPNPINDFRVDEDGRLKNRDESGNIVDQALEHRFARHEHVRDFYSRLQHDSRKELSSFSPEAVVSANAKARDAVLARVTDPKISASLIIDPQLGKRFHHLHHLSEAQLFSDVNAERIKGSLKDTYSPYANTGKSSVEGTIVSPSAPPSSPPLLHITPAAKHNYPLTINNQQTFQKQVAVLAGSIASIPTGTAEVKLREERRQKRYNGHISDAIRPASDVLSTFWVIFGVGAEHRVDFTDNIMRRHTIETYELVGREIRRYASRSDAYGTLMRLVALRETLLKALLDCARNPLLVKDKHAAEKQDKQLVEAKQHRQLQASMRLFGGNGYSGNMGGHSSSRLGETNELNGTIEENNVKRRRLSSSLNAARPSSGASSLGGTVTSLASSSKQSKLKARFRRVDILHKCAQNSHQNSLKELSEMSGNGESNIMTAGPYANGVGVMAQLATIRQQQQIINNTITKGGDEDEDESGRGYKPMQPVGPKEHQKGSGEHTKTNGGERLSDAALNSLGGGIDKPLTYSTHENLLLETLILITHLRHVTVLIVDMVQYERKCCRDLANAAVAVNTADVVGVNGAASDGKLLGSKNDINKLIEEDLIVRRSIAKRKAINKNVFEAHFKGLARKEREADARNSPSAVDKNAVDADTFEKMLEKHRKQQELEEKADRIRNAQRGAGRENDKTVVDSSRSEDLLKSFEEPRKRGVLHGKRTERPHQAGDIPLPLMWDGANYLIKMKNDLAPLDDTGLGELLRNVATIASTNKNGPHNALESCLSFTFANNPFILATKIQTESSSVGTNGTLARDGREAKNKTPLTMIATASTIPNTFVSSSANASSPTSIITINLNGLTRAPFEFIQKKDLRTTSGGLSFPRNIMSSPLPKATNVTNTRIEVAIEEEQEAQQPYAPVCDMLYKEDEELLEMEKLQKRQREHIRAKSRLAAHRSKILEEKERSQIGLLKNQMKVGASTLLPSSAALSPYRVHNSNASWQNTTTYGRGSSVGFSSANNHTNASSHLSMNFPPFIPDDENDDPEIIEIKRKQHYYQHQQRLNQATTEIVKSVTINSRHIPFDRFFLTQILEKEEGIGRGTGGKKMCVGSGVGSLDAAKKRLLGPSSTDAKYEPKKGGTANDIVREREKQLLEAEHLQQQHPSEHNNNSPSAVNASTALKDGTLSVTAGTAQHRGAYIPATHLQHYFDESVRPEENINLTTLREDGTHKNSFEYPVDIYFGGERPVWERTAVLLARSLDVDFMRKVNDFHMVHKGTGAVGPSVSTISPSSSSLKRRASKKITEAAQPELTSATPSPTAPTKSIHPRQIVMNKSRFKFTIAEEIKAHMASDRHRMFPPSLLNPSEDPVVDSVFHCYNVSWPVQQYSEAELREREAVIFDERPVETNRLESAKRKFQRALYKIKMALSYFRQVRETKKGKRLHLASLDFREWMVVAAPGFAATVERDLVKWFEPLRDSDAVKSF